MIGSGVTIIEVEHKMIEARVKGFGLNYHNIEDGVRMSEAGLRKPQAEVTKVGGASPSSKPDIHSIEAGVIITPGPTGWTPEQIAIVKRLADIALICLRELPPLRSS